MVIQGRKRRIALLYASAGTGHKTAALALARWFERESPGCETLCLDTLDFTNALVRGLYTRSYLEMVRRAPQLWGYFYDSLDEPEAADGVVATLNELTERLHLSRLIERLEAFNPDALLFTHFFGAAAVAERLLPRRPVFYVNTDFLSHLFHRHHPFTGWFVASDETALQYGADGIAMDRVVVSGIPVAPRYVALPSKAEARAALDLAGEERVVLVMGGGIGVGPFEEVITSLLEGDLTVLAVCGNNGKVRSRLDERFGGTARLKVFGFVDAIENHYVASDLIFTKPGGLSTSEILCTATPMVIVDPRPGQEQRNSDYLLDRGAARVLFDYRTALTKARTLLADEAERARLRRCALSLARPEAGRTVAVEVLERLERR